MCLNDTKDNDVKNVLLGSVLSEPGFLGTHCDMSDSNSCWSNLF